MKKLWISIVLLGIMLMVGCSSSATGQINSLQEQETAENTDIKMQPVKKEKMEVWCHYGGWEEIEKSFESLYPQVDVTIRTFTYNDYVTAYIDALSSGNVPDVMIIDSNHMGQFNTLDVFEDLSKPPYTATDYKPNFDPELWHTGLDFTQQKLIALPFATAPVVTYYRADIMEKYGFPSEPKALGDYMAHPNNWVKIGEKLKKDGIYITQWVAEPVTIIGRSQGYFDEKFNFKRDNPQFREAIDIAGAIRDAGIAASVGLWDENGQQYLKDGKFAMLYLGSWGAKNIESWVPEQSGKWRVTRLPFNSYGWNNSTLMSIPEQSKQKELAWKFIEYYTFKRKGEGVVGNVSSYLPFRNNVQALSTPNLFLGGQKEQEVYEAVLAQTKEYTLSPLDQQAEDIIQTQVNRGIERHYSTQTIMKNILDEIQNLVEKQKPLLLP